MSTSRTNAPQRVAVYARISEDEQDTEAGVKRQLEDARGLAAQRGWTVVAELQDNNISATNGKHRPGYTALMKAAESGAFERIVVYHTSRMWRNRLERAHGIDTLKQARVSVVAVKGPELDLSTAAGRGMAGLLGEFDTMESETKSERVVRAALDRAEAGAPNGAIPYGWTRLYKYDDKGKPIKGSAKDVQHDTEAPVVKAVCDRLLKGDSLLSVTAWLNDSGAPAPGAKFTLRGRERGVQNPDGARWGKTSVKKLALRPANAGLRIYHAGRDDERELKARIAPIITADEWRRLVVLIGPKRGTEPTPTRRPGGRTHLLTWGIGQCGVCGDVLRVTTKGPKRTALYACDAKGCVGRNEASVDTWVTAELVKVLSEPDVIDTLIDSEAADAAHSRAEALQGKLDTATDDYAADRIARDQFLTLTADLRPKITQANTEAANAAPTVPFELVRHVAGPWAGERFADLSVAQKRRLVDAFIGQVRIMPTRQGPGFRPEDVLIDWRNPR